MSRLVSTVPMGDKSWSRKYASELVVRESSHWGMGIVYECSCLSYRSWRNFAIAPSAEGRQSHDSIDRNRTSDPCRGDPPALLNNSNPFNWIGSPLAQTLAPNTIDGNGLNLRSHVSIDPNTTGDHTVCRLHVGAHGWCAI